MGTFWLWIFFFICSHKSAMSTIKYGRPATDVALIATKKEKKKSRRNQNLPPLHFYSNIDWFQFCTEVMDTKRKSEEARGEGGKVCFLLMFCYSCSVTFFLLFPLFFNPSPSTLLAETNSPFILLGSEGPGVCSHKACPSVTPHQPLLAQFIKQRPMGIYHPYHLSYPAPAESHCPSSDFNAAMTHP